MKNINSQHLDNLKSILIIIIFIFNFSNIVEAQNLIGTSHYVSLRTHSPTGLCLSSDDLVFRFITKDTVSVEYWSNVGCCCNYKKGFSFSKRKSNKHKYEIKNDSLIIPNLINEYSNITYKGNRIVGIYNFDTGNEMDGIAKVEFAMQQFDYTIWKQVSSISQNKLFQVVSIEGNWIEGEYNDSDKIVEPSKWRGKKQTLSFFKTEVKMTERGGCTPVKVWKGKCQIKNDALSIEYLDFKTTEGIEKETRIIKQYGILKLTENELVLFDLNGIGDETSYKGYLRNEK